MSSSDSSDEDNSDFQYWNNWKPPESENDVNKKNSLQENYSTPKTTHCNKKIMRISRVQVDSKFGNWIPPLNFMKNNGDITSKKLPLQKNQVEIVAETKAKKSEVEREKPYDVTTSELLKESTFNKNNWKKPLNLDWGNRVSLHNVTSFKDGELFWGIVNLGCFALIKLWVNEYGNICGLAEGTISKVGDSETSLISITSTQLLRKMLKITDAQWSSLCEVVQETKATLKFEAMNECDMSEKSSLERLWWFACKRRHFISELCMLVKLNGAVKCFKKLEIVPKLIVQDIRDLRGKQIL